MFFFGNGTVQSFVDFPVAGIESAVANHLEVFFRNMMNQTFYKIHDRQGFFHIGIVFMSVVVESDCLTVIFVDTGGCNDGAAKVVPNVFDNNLGVTYVWFCINIESMFIVFIAKSLHLLERGADDLFHLIEKGGTEGVAKKIIIKMVYTLPKSVVTKSTFGQKAVDMRIPFEVTSEGVKNHDKARSIIHGSVDLMKHTKNNTIYGMEETIKQGTIFQKKRTKMFVNSKDAVTVGNMNKLKGHICSTIHRIFDTAGRTKTAVTAKRNKFKIATVRAAIHGTTIGRIAAVNHFLNIFHFAVAGMEGILNLFVIIRENPL